MTAREELPGLPAATAAGAAGATAVEAAVADAFGAEWGRVVATVIGMTGEWDLAEECAQEAFAQALRVWPRDGVPRRPGAWLTTVARNRALDRLRRQAVETSRLRDAAILAAPSDPGDSVDDDIPDDRLRLIFTCCHPALPLDARVTLTLRTLAGLTTAEIARAFLVPVPTMAKRLVRAKHKIRNAAIPYRVPPAHLLPERTSGVLAVLYLLFNEGYAATAGSELTRQALCAEAIRLCRVLVQLMPDEPEVAALLALMLFQHSRRLARVNAAGDLVTLEEQDRSRWDKAEIAEAVGVLDAAARRGEAGFYLLQAQIAGSHATSPAAAETDWPRIAALYAELARLARSPVVELNRAVAVGMAQGPAAGLDLVDQLAASGALDDYYLLHATRADLKRRLGLLGPAATSYRRALTLTDNEAERRFLSARLASICGDA